MTKPPFSLLALLLGVLLLAGCGRNSAVETGASDRVGSHFTVLQSPARIGVPSNAQDSLPRATAIAHDFFRANAAPFDLGNPESELFRLNQLASEIRIPVSRDLRWAFIQAKRLHKHSDGVFDVTTSPLQIIYGFHQDSEDIVLTPGMIEATLGVVDLPGVEVAEDAVVFRNKGVQVDFRGMLNGYLLDRTILDLRQTDITQAYLQVDNCVRVLGRAGEDSLWEVPIPDLWQPGRDLGRLPLLPEHGTAWTIRDARQRRVNGEMVSSVIHPRTGEPARANAFALVTGGTATMCEAFSKVLLLEGAPAITNLVVNYEGAEALILQEFPEKRILISEGLELNWSSESAPYPLVVVPDPPNAAKPKHLILPTPAPPKGSTDTPN